MTEKELSPNAKTLWLKATSALQTQNYGYAISLLQAVLKDHPEFLTGRQFLRKAELVGKKSGNKFLSGISGSSLSVMKLQSLVKKDPKAAIIAAEDLLEKEPHSLQANGLLRDAAMAAQMPHVAGFALETMRDAAPKDTKVLHELARHYLNTSQPDKAGETYEAIKVLAPTDGDAIRGSKDAAARASMTKGGWDQVKEGSSYRDVLKNSEEAKSLEQKSRIVKSDDIIEQQLAENFVLYNENPENLDVVRKIASLYEQKEDFDNAVSYYSWAVSLTKNADPGLIRKVNDLTLKSIDRNIESREQWLAAQADAGQGAELDEETQGEITRIEAELIDYRGQKAHMQVDAARKRVDRNPTDLTFRYELGEQLVNIEEFSDAIPELQKAKTSPSLGLKATFLLGRCFESKGNLSLAVRQYEDARSKMPTMDGLKKDLIYDLGVLYEKMGDANKYLTCMTEIYEIDYGYRDVARRVEAVHEASS